eukprot:5409553-Pyramimonas_sp.AAC.1
MRTKPQSLNNPTNARATLVRKVALHNDVVCYAPGRSILKALRHLECARTRGMRARRRARVCNSSNAFCKCFLDMGGFDKRVCAKSASAVEH